MLHIVSYKNVVLGAEAFLNNANNDEPCSLDVTF